METHRGRVQAKWEASEEPPSHVGVLAAARRLGRDAAVSEGVGIPQDSSESCRSWALPLEGNDVHVFLLAMTRRGGILSLAPSTALMKTDDAFLKASSRLSWR